MMWGHVSLDERGGNAVGEELTLDGEELHTLAGCRSLLLLFLIGLILAHVLILLDGVGVDILGLVFLADASRNRNRGRTELVLWVDRCWRNNGTSCQAAKFACRWSRLR